MLWLDEQMKTLNDAELEDARENDYVWYFDLAMINATTKRDVDAEILRLYDACWPQVKTAMLRDYVHTRADGKTVKPSPSNMMNLRGNCRIDYLNTINDIDEILNEARRYRDRERYARDCLEMFDLSDDKLTRMNLQLTIGEALSDEGHIAESDAYYEQLLAQNPGNGYMIANYVLTMKMRGEKERAQHYLEQHISLDMAPTEENEMLFERARELYEELGDQELADKYSILQRSIRRGDAGYNGDSNEEWTAGAHIPSHMEPVQRVTEKVYPNDPCPCGSGKKYKKCCGRNG